MEYDVIIVGCGHAGCEAAAAAAKTGANTLLLALNLDTVALMPCNPAIGGPAKSHIVKEIDALGGLMGLASDATFLQMKTLNSSRGPAVHSLRAQSDKYEYSAWVKDYLNNIENLSMYQGMVTELLVDESSSTITGVRTRLGEEIKAKAVVITSGTFLQGKVFTGKETYESGRAGEPAVKGLTGSFQKYGFELGRLKTGTPPRLDARTINFDGLEIHPGDEELKYFSFLPSRPVRQQYPCHTTRTSELTHKLIEDNIHQTPLYGGLIEGKGPRYCPSIEDKIVKFPDKDSHNLFLEPESLRSHEIYLQGFSTSFGIDMQRKLVNSIPGLEQAHIIRPAYAVEYDFLKPVQFKHTLESKNIRGLYVAGQILGTSGYEEAAAQGLMAGINASLYTQEKQEFVLPREESYIGTLIDDLIYKEISEPYRMMTSRSEHRLYLRQDNADQRVTELGRKVGLVDDYRWQIYSEKIENYKIESKLLKTTRIAPEKAPARLGLKQHMLLSELLARVEVNYTDIDNILERDINNTLEIPRQAVETDIKYAGYINRQKSQLAKMKLIEEKLIPDNFDYEKITHLSRESREKLIEFKPKTINEARRIDGVRQADLNILAMFI